MSTKQHSISFLLGDDLVKIDFGKDDSVRPDMSLLHYLRHLRFTGVKEGCGEGDCGACTVVIASVKDSKLEYKAINSCLLLLPMVHGCQVITVEHLSHKKDGLLQLHPVQQALVEKHGSQCGYCTPGIVMSLFSLWKSGLRPSEDIIKNRLSGNLCRCTGYQPIIEAYMSIRHPGGEDHFSKSAVETIMMLKNISKESGDIEILKGDVHYFKPNNLESALLLRKKHPDALIIGGATDLAVAMNKHKLSIKKCIDLSGVDELSSVSMEDDMLKLGSGISVEELGKACISFFPAMQEMTHLFGSHQIRNLATVGGNIGSASPIGDLPPVLMAAGCSIELSSTTSKRRMLLEDFISGYHSTELKDDELITAILVPPGNGSIIKSYKVSKRKDVDISTVSAGFNINLDKNNTVQEIHLFYGGMAATTLRAAKAEEFLRGKEWTEETVQAAAMIIREEFEPISDARSGADARRIMAGNLLIRFWEETINEKHA
jgi:xanthine dehydrogenase small subunit